MADAKQPEFRPAQEPIQEQAPKRRGRPPGSKNRSRASLEAQIGGMLMTLNMVLYVIPPLQRDALDAAEIAALAKALDEQAKSSPKFRGYLEAALAAGSGGQLIGVVALIGARRAARHGIIPAEVDGMLGTMMQGATNKPAETPPPEAPNV